MATVQLIIAILATYRLAHLLPEDDGPFFIFKRIRSFTATKAVNENDDLGFWAMIDSGANCVFCCGLYVSFFIVGLVIWQNYFANLFLLVFAIAGGQSFLQKKGGE